MATRRAVNMISIQDENRQTEQIKKADTAVTTRPALGNLAKDLGNRTRLLNDKKTTATAAISVGAIENFPQNGSAAAIDLKNVKPRVDTHWKNDLPRRPLVTTRTSSGKSAASSAAVGIAGILGPANNSGPKLVRTKATETATLKEVKLVDKTDRSAQLKRQDSTLTRRKVVPVTKKVTTTATTTKTTGTITIVKKTATHAKSSDTDSDSAASSNTIASVPPIQSRFRPPTFSSYSNGLIDGFGGMNIDDGDEKNQLLVCEYVNDIYAYLFEMERKYAIRKAHLDGQTEIHPRMRTVLLDWISEVHTQYHFAQETFHITVTTIDRYLQTVKSTSRKNLQLVGVAALLIASKYEELYPPEVQDFVYITDNTYTKNQILAMEKHILKKLKFEMGVPTPIHFLRRFSKAAQADAQTHCLSKYFIELAAIDYNLSEYLPSEIAAAALYISLAFMEKLLNPEMAWPTIIGSLWTPTLAFYSTYDAAYLRPIVKEFIAYIESSPSSKTNNVYTKYAAAKQSEISVICDKNSHILSEIIETIELN